MKKQSIYALIGAIALSGSIGFSSCSSSDDSAEVNPNFNPQTNEVLTQFLFNVSTSNTASTRQEAAATQALPTSVFRGIDDSHILCFKTGTENNGKWIDLGTTTVDRDYPMHAVAAASTMSSDHSARVLEMSLPLKTNTMMFYGRATKNDDKNAYGCLKNNDGTDGYNIPANMSPVGETKHTLNEISFHLGRRLTTDDKAEFQETQKLLAGVLTCVMNVKRGTDEVTANLKPSGNVATAYRFDIPASETLTWASYVKGGNSPVATSSPMDPLEEKLAKAHYEMTHIKAAELRNASGPAVLAMIEDLWTIVNSVRCANPISVAEATAKYMAERINLELQQYFGTSSLPADGGVVEISTIKTPQVIVPLLVADTNWPANTGKPVSGDFGNISTENDGDYLNEFPGSFDLPQGSTHIRYNEGGTYSDPNMPLGTPEKTFYYVVDYNASAAGNGAFTVDDYYYPPELLYFGNSPLRVSDQEHVVSQYPQNTTDWNNEDSWPAPSGSDPEGAKRWTTNGEVLSSTRSVAMKNDINYGTALLQTTVSYYIPNGYLEDNNHAIQVADYQVDENTEPNHQIIPTNTTFKLVGVLVGGQYPEVGWNFLPRPLGDGHMGYVYDKVIAGEGAIPTTGSSAPNYTLLFDNYKPGSGNDADAQDKVYVALEFQNNGPDFFGHDNLITNGSNFYLIGELDPSNKTISSWPSYHALPPYTNGTTMAKVPRVFIQDYMTKANFKIGQKSLQYAYLTVPDLRASSVTLGLSVDLIWSTGMEFDVVIGGGN